MNQSSALRRLEIILDDAVKNGQQEEICGKILLKSMNLHQVPSNLVYFYSLLAKAYAEAEGLINLPKLTNYLKVLEDLNQLFTTNHIWTLQWHTFYNHIQSRNSLSILDSLANYQHSANPKWTLESDFLEKLQAEFESLVKQIDESDLSQKVKKDLIKKVRSILKTIQQYNVEGTEGIEQVVKQTLFDLITTESKISVEEKGSPVFRRFTSSLLALWNILAVAISAPPDIEQYWIPKFQDFQNARQKIETTIDEETILEAILEENSDIFYEKETSTITGREIPALSPSEQGAEPKNECENNP